MTHGAVDARIEETPLKWPIGVYSLSHVALPFSPADPVYGGPARERQKIIYLGNPEVQGERGLLAIAPSSLIRLRHNPFFDYLAARAEAQVQSAR